MVSSEEFFSKRPVGIDSEAVSVEAALRVLVNRFPCIGSFPHLKRLCKEQTGDTKVTLSWFYEEYPSFPIRVVYKNIPWVRDMWSGLHSGFKRTELYTAWKSNEDAIKLSGVDDFLTKPTAVVFNWPSWKMCCIHNLESKQFGGSWYSVAAAKDDDCLKIYKSLKNGESFVIEPFEQLLDSITWSN